MMTDKKLTMADIANKIFEEWGTDLHTIFEDDNTEKLIMRVRMVSDAAQDKGDADQDDAFLRRIEGNMLNEMTLCGIPAIRKVFMCEEKKVTFNEEGSVISENEWILDTEGVNLLLEVLSYPNVDHTHTVSNDIIEKIIQVLGE
jgi:DNA-directed RNA polymerase II subunit RPB1